MSKKIRVVFYRAKTGDGHWLDNAINSWTWLISAKNRQVGPYSHVEIWTPHPEKRGNPDMQEQLQWMYPHAINVDPATGYDIFVDKAVGTCWTSTMRGENNGTVSRPANTVIENMERWDFAEIEVSEETLKDLLWWMNDEVDNNMGYSKRDILKFMSPIHFPDNTRNICSEFVNDALAGCYVIKDTGIVSPRRLAWKLKQAGYEIKPLADSGFPIVGNPTQQDIDNIVKEIE